MKQLTSFLRTCSAVTLYVVTAAVPLFFFTRTTDYFDFNKRMFIVLATGCFILLWAAFTLTKKIVRITISPLLLPLLTYAGALLLSSFIATPYWYEAIMGKTLLIVSLTLLFLFATTMVKIKTARTFLFVLSGGR